MVRITLPALLGALALCSSTSARQIPVVDGVVGGVPHGVLQTFDEEVVLPQATTPGKLRIKENSGVCETTPGVYQASGYGDLTSSESIWYVVRYSVT